jgi:hypothetical protein
VEEVILGKREVIIIFLVIVGGWTAKVLPTFILLCLLLLVRADPPRLLRCWCLGGSRKCATPLPRRCQEVHVADAPAAAGSVRGRCFVGAKEVRGAVAQAAAESAGRRGPSGGRKYAAPLLRRTQEYGSPMPRRRQEDERSRCSAGARKCAAPWPTPEAGSAQRRCSAGARKCAAPWPPRRREVRDAVAPPVGAGGGPRTATGWPACRQL